MCEVTLAEIKESWRIHANDLYHGIVPAYVEVPHLNTKVWNNKIFVQEQVMEWFFNYSGIESKKEYCADVLYTDGRHPHYWYIHWKTNFTTAVFVFRDHKMALEFKLAWC